MDSNALDTYPIKHGKWLPLLTRLPVSFQRMSDSLRGALEAQAGDPRSPILLYHLLDGKLTTRDMRADQLVETRSGAQLRLNKYSNHVRQTAFIAGQHGNNHNGNKNA